MCRTAAEYPPNGKRCGRGDHLSPAVKQAHRDKYNARRRELYAIRKAEADGTVASSFIQTTEQSLCLGKPISEYPSEKYAEQVQYLADNKDELSHMEGFGKLEDIEVLLHTLTTEKSALQGEIAYVDEEYDTESINTVHRVGLADGSAGYFKPLKNYTEKSYASNEVSFNQYWIYDAQDTMNEVAAYKLAQALGGDFARLVPETSIRELNGVLGSVQREVVANGGLFEETSQEHADNCAIFDWVAGSMDRHSGNFLAVEPPREERLIDNGLSFPKGVTPNGMGVGMAAFTDPYHTILRLNSTMNHKAFKQLRALVESPDGLGMKNYLSKEAYEGMHERAEMLLRGVTEEEYEKFMGTNYKQMYVVPFSGGKVRPGYEDKYEQELLEETKGSHEILAEFEEVTFSSNPFEDLD